MRYLANTFASFSVFWISVYFCNLHVHQDGSKFLNIGNCTQVWFPNYAKTRSMVIKMAQNWTLNCGIDPRFAQKLEFLTQNWPFVFFEKVDVCFKPVQASHRVTAASTGFTHPCLLRLGPPPNPRQWPIGYHFGHSG